MGAASIRHFPQYIAVGAEDKVEFTEDFRMYLDSKFSSLEKTLETHTIESEKTAEHFRRDIGDLYEKHREVCTQVRDSKDSVLEVLDAKNEAMSTRVAALESRQSKDEGGAAQAAKYGGWIIGALGVGYGIIRSLLGG